MPKLHIYNYKKPVFRLSLVLLLVAGYLFFFYLPKYEDSRRNTVTPFNPLTNKAIVNLHNSLFVADLHADTLLWNRTLSSRNKYGHVDIPRLQDGNIRLQVFSVVTKVPRNLNYNSNNDQSDNITLLAIAQRWPKRTWKSLLQRAIYQADKLHNAAKNDDFTLIQSKRDLNRLIDANKKNKQLTGGLLSLEGSHALEGRLENVDVLFNKGFRIFGFTHFFDNELGGSAHGINKSGITKFGVDVLKRMEQLGILVDISHASSRLIDDILDHATKPIIATHTGVAAVCNSSRNLTDTQIKQIAQTGGIIGIGFWPSAICSDDVSGLIKSFRHVIMLVGIDHAALGSDFDGNVQTPFDAANINLITDALVKNGFNENQIRKIMGKNIIDLLLRTLPE